MNEFSRILEFHSQILKYIFTIVYNMFICLYSSGKSVILFYCFFIFLVLNLGYAGSWSLQAYISFPFSLKRKTFFFIIHTTPNSHSVPFSHYHQISSYATPFQSSDRKGTLLWRRSKAFLTINRLSKVLSKEKSFPKWQYMW